MKSAMFGKQEVRLNRQFYYFSEKTLVFIIS